MSLPIFKLTVGFTCEILSPRFPGIHIISYVGKHGFTAGPYSVSTSHSNVFNYIIYGLLHPSTGVPLTNISDIRKFYPEYLV